MKRRSGMTLIEVLVTVAIVAILSFIAIPRYMSFRHSAYNGSAEALAKNVELVEEAYKTAHDRYTGDMNDLLALNKNLLDTPNITFVWIGVSVSSYTLNVRHINGDRWFTAMD